MGRNCLDGVLRGNIGVRIGASALGPLPSGRCEEIDRCTHIVIVTYSSSLYSAGMSNMPAPPLPRLTSIDRSQLLLHTLDVERLIDEDHSARSIRHLVARMNLSLYQTELSLS
jgi:hypothetical protein